MATYGSPGDYCFLLIDGERWPAVIITEQMATRQGKPRKQPESIPVFAIVKDTM
jgi:hypothetical protein